MSFLIDEEAAAAGRPLTAPPANPIPPKPKRPTTFAEYLRDVSDVVQTGAVRAGDENADFSPCR